MLYDIFNIKSYGENFVKIGICWGSGNMWPMKYGRHEFESPLDKSLLH